MRKKKEVRELREKAIVVKERRKKGKRRKQGRRENRE